jgi:zinc/manganese transport system substrate-binding protein
VHVVAAENFWGNITQQIGGSHVDVTSIISDPNADPHTYETDPKDAAAISAASFVILNGVGYDDFASKLLSASPNSSRTVINIQKVAGVTGSNPNPHLWYDPTYVKDAADAITAALAKADPVDATTFTANEQTFLTAYQPYIDELAKIKAKYAGTKISYTERVPGYLVQAAGLVLGTPASFSQAVEDGNDPSPGDTATFNADITGHKVKVLLYNGQVTDSQTDKIKSLARSSGVPIVGVAETLPPNGQNFQTWQLDQAKEIFAALGG